MMTTLFRRTNLEVAGRGDGQIADLLLPLILLPLLIFLFLAVAAFFLVVNDSDGR